MSAEDKENVPLVQPKQRPPKELLTR